jgi:hypothetical protein
MQKMIALLFVFASSAFASGVEQVVKVQSAPCGGSSASVRTSSGIAFNNGHQALVLVQESRIFHGSEKQGFCHQVRFPESPDWSKAEFFHIDWRSGLALLKFESALPLVGLDHLLDSRTTAPKNSGQVSGFALSSATRTLSNARILLSDSRRTSIPGVERVIEIQSAPVDAGFIGGALLGPNGKILGMISQEYIRMMPGGTSRPTEWGFAPASRERHLVVIPAEKLLIWVAAGISPSLYRVDPKDQLLSKPRITAGRIRYEMECPPPGSTPRPEDGFPIGGVDAAGIGGDSLQDRACRVKLSLAEEATQLPPPFFGQTDPIWADYLKQGARIEIPFFSTNHDENGAVQEHSHRLLIHSLGEFFKDAVSEKFPADVVWLKDARVPGTEPELAEVRKAAQVAIERALWVYQHAPLLDADCRELLRRVYYYLELIQSSQNQRLSKEEFNRLLSAGGPYFHAWVTIQSQMGGADLYRDLVDLWRVMR